MNNLDWHKAKPITFEYLHSNYSYGDLAFSGLTLEGGIDGVLHLSHFYPSSRVRADLFVLFKDIRKIGKSSEIDGPFFRYEIETIDRSSAVKWLKMNFDNGSIEIDYKDDLLYLCALPSGEFVEL